MEAARAEGIECLHAEASVLSRPLFEAVGFVVTGTEIVERQGVAIERFLVEHAEKASP